MCALREEINLMENVGSLTTCERFLIRTTRHIE